MHKITISGSIAAFTFCGLVALAFIFNPAFAPLAPAAEKWLAPAASKSKKNPIAGDAASVKNGKKIYEKECASCHGHKGMGDGPKASDQSVPPGNLTTRAFQSQTDGEIFWKITQGKKPMPSFRTAYADNDRWSIVNFLRSLANNP